MHIINAFQSQQLAISRWAIAEATSGCDNGHNESIADHSENETKLTVVASIIAFSRCHIGNTSIVARTCPPSPPRPADHLLHTRHYGYGCAPSTSLDTEWRAYRATASLCGAFA